MPNVIAALPNIDGALCSTPQSLADAKYYYYSAVQQRCQDLHSKFALRPQHVWKYGRHPVCDR